MYIYGLTTLNTYYICMYVYMGSHNHHNNIKNWVLEINRHSPLHFKLSLPNFRNIC